MARKRTSAMEEMAARLRQAMIEGSKEPLTDPQTVWIHYDPKLTAITGRSCEKAMVSKGCPFWMVLNGVLESYPKVKARYPAESGLLGFALNGIAPEFYTPLYDGDVISFVVPDKPGPFSVH